MDNSSRTYDDKLLEKLNQEEVMRQIPLMTCLLMLAVVGTLGNLLVCFVYKKKYSASNCRTFVIVLSAIDVFICAVIIPFEIVVLLREYNFKQSWICKVSVFLNTWPTLTTGFLLLAIAIERYRKVCQPFSWQITHSAAINMCVMSGVLGLAFSWISPVIYGAQKSTHIIYNITISQCTETDAMKQTVWPLLNSIFFAVLFTGALTGIIVMYCFIAVRVKQHIERKSKFLPSRQKYIVNDAEVSEMTVMSGKVAVRKKVKIKNDETSDSIFRSSDSLNSKGGNEISEPEKTSMILCSVEGVKCEERSSVNRKSIISRMLSFGRQSLSLTKTFSTSTTSTIRQNIRIRPEAQKQKQRTAYIMFLISLAFIISYLPLLCLLLIRVSDSTFVPSLNDTERAVYKFCLRSYYINSVVNPFIYGLWDSRFRKSCRKIVCKGKCK